MKLFLQEFLNKKYVIGLIKLHSNLEIDNKLILIKITNFLILLIGLIKIIIKFMKKIL